jgi:ketosteroid isomerase-like protein
MSAENVEIVRRATEEYLVKGGLDFTILADDVEIHDHDILDGREYRGQRGFVRWLEDWGEAWERWTVEPVEYLDAGDKVVLVFRMVAKGRGSGLELDRLDTLVYEFRDGKAVRLDYFNNREEGLAAAGLAA